MPMDDVVRQFARRDMDEQYGIYVCGVQYMHPPYIQLAAAFASEGTPAGDYLTRKVVAGVDDLTFRDITFVFHEMALLGTYRLADNPELVGTIERRARLMTNTEMHRDVELLMPRIRAPE